MINTTEALNLFCEKMEPGDKEVAILNNCTMIIELTQDKELKISFSGNEPIFINDNLDMYVE